MNPGKRWFTAALALGLGMAATSRALEIAGGTAIMVLDEGKADGIGWLNAHFSDVITRGQALSEPAPGDAPLVRLSGVPGTNGTSVTIGEPGVPGQLRVVDTIRPSGEIPNPPLPDTYPGVPGTSRSRQLTTLDFDPTDILGSWSPSIDQNGIFVPVSATSEQIAFTGMQRWGGPFTGALLYGDFALRHVPGRAGRMAAGGPLSGLALTSNIDFLNSSWADLANASITFSNNTLIISGDLLISGALFILDPSAVVGTKIGTFNLTADIVLPLAPVIHHFAVSAGTATLLATNGPPGGGYTVLSSTNLASPVSQWETVSTGTFAGDGTATNSIPSNAGEAARFFRLQQP